VYLRRLRSVHALGGVGRQSGVYMRHRKPHGSQVASLLCLLLWLLAGAMCFIVQAVVLFRLGPRHNAFFASLLCPPFAEVLGLVLCLLFVCGAFSEGTTVCLFVVASNSNVALGLVGRCIAMDTLRSVGLLYVLVEYVFTFASKVAICRLVNLLIAHAEVEPALLDNLCQDADYEWVREHVLFPRASAGGSAGTLAQESDSLEAPSQALGSFAAAIPRITSDEEMMRAINRPCNEARHRSLASFGSFSEGAVPLLHDHRSET